jgi:exosortase
MRIVFRRSVASVVLLSASLLWVYRDVLSSLVRQWASDDNYSHGFFVLPLALYFAWERRYALGRAASAPATSGLVVIALSMLLLMTGVLGAELFLARVSLVGAIVGAVLYVWGRAHARALAFPLAFLLFMVPIPAILFNRIAFPLQLLASRAGELAIAGAGVPVLRDGNVLMLPQRTLEVAEACSGIRSVVSLVMLAVVLGQFVERRPAVRAALAVAAVPIAVLANAIRVAGTGLASEWVSPEAADGFFHAFSGWLMFVAAFGALLGVHRLLTRLRVSGSIRATRFGAAAAPDSSGAQREAA